MLNEELNKFLDMAEKNQKAIHEQLIKQREIIEAMPNLNPSGADLYPLRLKAVYNKYRII